MLFQDTDLLTVRIAALVAEIQNLEAPHHVAGVAEIVGVLGRGVVQIHRDPAHQIVVVPKTLPECAPQAEQADHTHHHQGSGGAAHEDEGPEAALILREIGQQQGQKAQQI